MLGHTKGGWAGFFRPKGVGSGVYRVKNGGGGGQCMFEEEKNLFQVYTVKI